MKYFLILHAVQVHGKLPNQFLAEVDILLDLLFGFTGNASS